MFVSSKKFVAPLAALLVACMAVDAVTLPQNCLCSDVGGHSVDKTVATCSAVGQGAVYDGHNCKVDTLSAYNNFTSTCTVLYSDSKAICSDIPVSVPLPQSCSCADPSGVNTVAQTKTACGLASGLGTMVGDKCVVSLQGTYTIFFYGCPKWYPGSTAVCSAQ